MPLACRPRLYLETIEGVTVITISGPELIAEHVLVELAAQFDEIDGPGLSRVLVNFREVRTMSSGLLGVLMKLQRRVRAAGGQLKLCQIAPDLFVAFRITRFDRLFDIHDEEWTALDAFRA